MMYVFSYSTLYYYTIPCSIRPPPQGRPRRRAPPGKSIAGPARRSPRVTPIH